MLKKTLSFLLAMVMVLSLCQTAVFAAGECAHSSWKTTTLKEATCTASGVLKKTCETCPEVKYVLIPAGHEWEKEGTVTTSATCAKEGVKTFKCTKCDATKEVAIPKTTDHVWVQGIEPTCQHGGTAAKVCSVCYAREDGAALEKPATAHDYKEVLLTEKYECGKLGKYVKVCNDCGNKSEEYEAVMPHVYGEDEEYIPATCTSNAHSKKVCEKCGEPWYTDLGYLGGINKAQGHKLEEKLTTVDPTCKTDGYKGNKCERCDYIGNKVVIPATPGENHVFELVDVVKPATCTTTGVGKYVCEKCGTTAYKTISLSHKWGEVVVEDAPTCEGTGVGVKTCALCGGTEKVELKATGHKWEENYFIEATCEEPAKVGKYCPVCKKEDGMTTVGDPLGHDEQKEIIKQFTCTEWGKERTYCSRCDWKTDPIDVAPHHIKGEPQYVAATCTEGAKMVVYCTVCEKEIPGSEVPVEGADGKPLGHDVEGVKATNKEATCMTPGYNGAKICKRCEEPVGGDPIAPNGKHNLVLVKTLNPATCTEKGVGVYKCTNVDADGKACSHSETAPIKSNHEAGVNTVAIVTKAPTCTEVGSKVVTCTVCNKSWTETIPALSDKGHNWVKDHVEPATCTSNQKVGTWCSLCETFKPGEVTEFEGTQLEHNWDYENAELVEAATCVKAGSKKMVCKDCKTEDTLVIPALSADGKHGKEVDLEDVEATCKTEGRKGGKKCTVCGVTTVEPKNLGIDANNHKEGPVTVMHAPTCTAQGVGKYVCNECGKTRYAAIGKIEHTYDYSKEEVITPVTCTVDGKSKIPCTVCGQTVTVTKKAPGHVMGEVPVIVDGVAYYACAHCDYKVPVGCTHVVYEEKTTPATCTKEGETYKVCKVCGEDFDHDTLPMHPNREPIAAVEATCTKAGHTAGVYCPDCDTYLVEPTIIPVKAHTPVPMEPVEATCLKRGLSGGEKCSTCGLVLVEQTATKKVGHNLVDNECTVCGYHAGNGTPCLHENIREVHAQSATCESIGYKAYKVCLDCHAYIDYRPYFGGHKSEESKSEKPATCTEAGWTAEKRCNVCGTITQVSVMRPATGSHNLVTVGTVPATCTSNGWTGSEVCLDCGIVFTPSTQTEKAEHNKVAIGEAKKATCTETGLTAGVKCSVCGEVLEAQKIIPVLKHEYVEDIAGKEATCTEPGYTAVEHCPNCGDVKKSVAIPALGHDEKIVPGYAATCTENGLTDGKVCGRKDCGVVIKQQEVILATDHTEKKVPAQPATCLEDGWTEYTICAVCNDILTAPEKIPAAGEHTLVEIPAVEATCTKTGLTAGYKCSVCGDVVIPQEEVPMKEHTLVEIPAVEATCTKTGLTAGYKCSVCGEVVIPQEEIPMVDHTLEEVPGKEPTCNETGLTSSWKCSVCGQEIIPAEEIPVSDVHSAATVVGKPATCGQAGLTDGTVCSICGKVIVAQETIPATGKHSEVIAGFGHYDNGVAYIIYRCSVCGAERTITSAG